MKSKYKIFTDICSLKKQDINIPRIELNKKKSNDLNKTKFFSLNPFPFLQWQSNESFLNNNSIAYLNSVHPTKLRLNLKEAPSTNLKGLKEAPFTSELFPEPNNRALLGTKAVEVTTRKWGATLQRHKQQWKRLKAKKSKPSDVLYKYLNTFSKYSTRIKGLLFKYNQLIAYNFKKKIKLRGVEPLTNNTLNLKTNKNNYTSAEQFLENVTTETLSKNILTNIKNVLNKPLGSRYPKYSQLYPPISKTTLASSYPLGPGATSYPPAPFAFELQCAAAAAGHIAPLAAATAQAKAKVIGGGVSHNKGAPVASLPMEVQEAKTKVANAQRPRLGAAGKRATVALPIALHFISDAKAKAKAKGAIETKITVVPNRLKRVEAATTRALLLKLKRLNNVKGKIVYLRPVTNRVLKYSYKLLLYFFKSMYCLISKPVFIFNPEKVVIQLIYFLNIPKFKVFKWYSIVKTKVIGKKRKDSPKYKYKFLKLKRRLVRTLVRLYNKQSSVQNILFNLNKYNLFKVFSPKFKLICEIFNKNFKKPVELQLIRTHQPFHDSNILVNLLSLNIKNKKFKTNVKIAKLFQKRVVKNISENKIKSVNFIPSYISGVNIRIGGRLLREVVIPRISKKNFERGARSIGKVNYLDSASITNKNRKGSYTLKIFLGQNIFGMGLGLGLGLGLG